MGARGRIVLIALPPPPSRRYATPQALAKRGPDVERPVTAADAAVLAPDAWCLEVLDGHEPAVVEGAKAHRASLTGGNLPLDTWLERLRAPHVGLPETADRFANMRDQL